MEREMTNNTALDLSDINLPMWLEQSVRDLDSHIMDSWEVISPTVCKLVLCPDIESLREYFAYVEPSTSPILRFVWEAMVLDTEKPSMFLSWLSWLCCDLILPLWSWTCKGSKPQYVVDTLKEYLDGNQDNLTPEISAELCKVAIPDHKKTWFERDKVGYQTCGSAVAEAVRYAAQVVCHKEVCFTGQVISCVDLATEVAPLNFKMGDFRRWFIDHAVPQAWAHACRATNKPICDEKTDFMDKNK